MPNTIFEFKQFTIQQDRCAMKVGTDGVLLGAWTDCEGANTILDIGTGTGLIALMLAQKSQAKIVAIDIDASAVSQAKENISRSHFSKQIEIFQYSFQDFCRTSNHKFDLIVTNPPYFQQSYKSSDAHRSLARHADSLPNDELIVGVRMILNPKGKFCIILPRVEAEQFIQMAKESNLYLSQLLRIKSRADKDVEKRYIMQFGFDETDLKEDVLVIEENERHQYTEKYKELTKNYYLHF
jgi:tRNA1Val (adenine37-N6)-methyltransferase